MFQLFAVCAENPSVDDTLRNITPAPPVAEADPARDHSPHACREHREHREHREYAAIVGDLPIGVLGLDSDGRITLINPTARRFLEIEHDCPVGEPVHTLVGNATARDAVHDAIEFSRDGYPVTREFRFGEYAIELRSAFTGTEDRLSNTVITLENVTWRHEISARKDEFLSLVSHELRTPLTVIRGYLDIFHRGMMGEFTDEQKECTDLMIKQCVRLEELIRDLVRFRNITRGVASAAGEPLAIAQATRESVSELIDDIGHAGMRLKIDVSDGELSVWCSRAHFETVIRHLVDNAIKFAGAGCTVRISAEEFDLSRLPSTDRLVIKRDPPPHTRWASISVTDDGPGIPEDTRGKVFDTFQQGEAHLTRSKRGLGLGLPLVREIVDSAGGTLWIDDAIERGTKITIILPLIHGDKSTPKIHHAPARQGVPV